MTTLSRHQRGQTLLEVIVAVGVVVAGVLGTISVVVASLRAGRVAADRLTALNLAREGMEIVRNIRDSNWLDTADVWDSGLTGDNEAVPVLHDTDPLVPVTLDFTPDGWADAGSSGRIWTKVYRGTKRYTQGIDLAANGATNFSRIIYFSPICWSAAGAESVDPARANTSANDCPPANPNEVGMQVRVEVRWPSTAATAHKVILEDRLYNWK